VALIGDIERGGVIAQIVGTHALLTPDERARLVGYVVNKFRGDVALFDGGITAIGERTGMRCFGVVPYFAAAASLPAEDSMALSASRAPTRLRPNPPPLAGEGRVESMRGRERGSAADNPLPRKRGRAGVGADAPQNRLRIAVPLLPRIANFDDLDPLRAEPSVELILVRPGTPLPRDAALVILPGSKATLADLAVLRREGWDIDILAHRRHGGHIIGLCGGYQMLGRRIADPDGVEGPPGEAPGLGLLEVETVLNGSKRLTETAGVEIASGMRVRGYEMHLGATGGPGLARPMLDLGGRTDGAASADGKVAGCYLHGIFASDPFRRHVLARLGVEGDEIAYEAMVEAALDGLADHLERHLDVAALLAAARPPRLTRAA
jgi:adenosylcobyric acid synthase